MPPVVNPVSDLARIYRQRIPTQTSQARFGPEAVARIQPNMNRGAGPLGAVGRLARTAVESLDPRLILSEGGRSVEHAVGDATELAKSVISGRDTLSQSPTARTYQAAGGGAQGAFAAAMPYVNLASTAAPFVAPARAAMLERAAARQTADATEQLARQMAERSAPRVLPDRPIIRMRPTTQYGTAMEGAQGSVVLADESGLTTLRPVQPSTQRPEWMGPTPEQQLSQRDMDLLRTNSLEVATNTPEDYARSLRIMGKRHNPLTTNVDWATTDPARDLDWDKFFSSELDAQMYSPEAGQLYAAQAAARNGIMDFLTRNGLMSKFVANAPEYMASRLRNPQDVQRLIQIQMWPDLMKQVPELRDYYVNTMRSYGIGL